jgi:hypothetical protein
MLMSQAYIDDCEGRGMAMRRLDSRPRKSGGSSKTGRSPRSRRPAAGGSHAYGVALPESLHEAIEAERGNLAKAESVLGCLTIAMEYGDTDSTTGPYYPDVAQVARDLVRRSINALDSLTLQRRLAEDRVKEGSIIPAAMLPAAQPEHAIAIYRVDPSLRLLPAGLAQ